jgi:hypothetical protein
MNESFASNIMTGPQALGQQKIRVDHDLKRRSPLHLLHSRWHTDLALRASGGWVATEDSLPDQKGQNKV